MFVLIALSAVFFILQQLLFHDVEESGFLFFQDMIFLPLHILLVTFLLDRVLSTREKRERLEKVNIVISAFFSETGSDTLKTLNDVIANVHEVKERVEMTPSWNDKAFYNAALAVKSCSVHVNINTQNLDTLKSALPQKEEIVKMFANPNLLEHDTFTDMLWALYHLIDELSNRQDVQALPETDIHHLKGDIVRVYNLLAYEWVIYMKHLKSRYPYLWSLAIRKNPFSEHTSVIIQAS
jgi:hypothetical protein